MHAVCSHQGLLNIGTGGTCASTHCNASCSPDALCCLPISGFCEDKEGHNRVVMLQKYYFWCLPQVPSVNIEGGI